MGLKIIALCHDSDDEYGDIGEIVDVPNITLLMILGLKGI